MTTASRRFGFCSGFLLFALTGAVAQIEPASTPPESDQQLNRAKKPATKVAPANKKVAANARFRIATEVCQRGS